MNISFQDKLLIDQALRALRQTKREHVKVIRNLRDSEFYSVEQASKRIAELRSEHSESVRLTNRLFLNVCGGIAP